jgi:predicted PhzF superfamily epimerase YddE/YHI9
MELELFIVDAFTEQQFKGNSAAVVPLKEWLPDSLMQGIASENNLSETAFIKPNQNHGYDIRWFSPITEIDFCGHATLAASYVLFNHFSYQGVIRYTTLKVGDLNVAQSDNGQIIMNFPKQPPELVKDIPQALLDGLSIRPTTVLRNRQAYFAILPDEASVKRVTYDSELLKSLAPYDVVVTSSSEQYDFVSRYFWPANGGDEDPVTGSIHTGLAPYWGMILGKNSLVAYQASQRGGVVYCEIQSDRVQISGYGVLYMQGKIYV